MTRQAPHTLDAVCTNVEGTCLHTALPEQILGHHNATRLSGLGKQAHDTK